MNEDDLHRTRIVMRELIRQLQQNKELPEITLYIENGTLDIIISDISYWSSFHFINNPVEFINNYV